MSKCTCDGIIGFHQSVKVSPEEMREWQPERITAFFDGLAKAIAAAKGSEPPTAAEPQGEM